MGAGAHLDDWLAYGPGFMIRRRMAMKIAFVNKPEGKGYAQAFAALMHVDGLHTMDKTSVSAILWLYDDPERMTILRQIRDTMTVGERAEDVFFANSEAGADRVGIDPYPLELSEQLCEPIRL